MVIEIDAPRLQDSHFCFDFIVLPTTWMQSDTDQFLYNTEWLL